MSKDIESSIILFSIDLLRNSEIEELNKKICENECENVFELSEKMIYGKVSYWNKVSFHENFYMLNRICDFLNS